MIELINKFLAEHRIALIGASRNPKHFSRLVMADYLKHGYEMLPVNPGLTELHGKPCWKTIAEIAPIPTAAMIMVSASQFEKTVREAADVGVKTIWLVRGKADKQTRASAIDYCRSKNIAVIDAACPLMYLKETAMPHAIHGWIWKLVGMWGR